MTVSRSRFIRRKYGLTHSGPQYGQFIKSAHSAPPRLKLLVHYVRAITAFWVEYYSVQRMLKGPNDNSNPVS